MMDTPGSAIEMVNRCFRYQHPEAFDRPEVPEATIPTELRYGRDEIHYPPTPIIPEEPQGNGETVPVETIAYG